MLINSIELLSCLFKLDFYNLSWLVFMHEPSIHNIYSIYIKCDIR